MADSDDEVLSIIEENFDSYSNSNGYMLNGTSTIMAKSLLYDPSVKDLERLVMSSPVYRDFVRLGLLDGFDGMPNIQSVISSLVRCEENDSKLLGCDQPAGVAKDGKLT